MKITMDARTIDALRKQLAWMEKQARKAHKLYQAGHVTYASWAALHEAANKLEHQINELLAREDVRRIAREERRDDANF